jgi:SNF family Na+-dependent transporter
MLLVVGMPLLLLELALGQKLRVGAARAWYKVHPALGGIGYGSTVVAGLVGCYYNVIIAWCIFYLWSSMNVSGWEMLETKQPKTVPRMIFIHSSESFPPDS